MCCDVKCQTSSTSSGFLLRVIQTNDNWTLICNRLKSNFVLNSGHNVAETFTKYTKAYGDEAQLRSRGFQNCLKHLKITGNPIQVLEDGRRQELTSIELGSAVYGRSTVRIFADDMNRTTGLQMFTNGFVMRIVRVTNYWREAKQDGGVLWSSRKNIKWFRLLPGKKKLLLPVADEIVDIWVWFGTKWQELPYTKTQHVQKSKQEQVKTMIICSFGGFVRKEYAYSIDCSPRNSWRACGRVAHVSTSMTLQLVRTALSVNEFFAKDNIPVVPQPLILLTWAPVTALRDWTRSQRTPLWDENTLKENPVSDFQQWRVENCLQPLYGFPRELISRR